MLITEKRKEFIDKMHKEERSTLLKFLTFEEQDIIVDWEALEEERNKGRAHAKTYENILSYLEHKGILRSAARKNTFMVIGSGMNLNPGYAFAREEDAIGHAKARYKKAIYPVQIVEVKTNRVNK